jgi:hypothetical protein
MGKSRKRRGQRRSRKLLSKGGSGARALAAHPVRSASLGVLACALGWLVATSSLPYALAPLAPEAALALNPQNPEALLAKAELLREALLSLTAGKPKPQELDVGFTPQRVAAESERESLREEIRALASKAVAVDSLNAEGYRLLAETSVKPEEAAALMRAAFDRSRRETIALFWLLNDSFYRHDFTSALYYADILLSTRPELAEFVFSYLGDISRDGAGRALLVRKVAEHPNWRSYFLQFLPTLMSKGAAAIDVIGELTAIGSPPDGYDLAPILSHLIALDRSDIAYNIWLQSLPFQERASLGLLTNPSFEKDPSGSPFDWKIDRGLNAVAELTSGEGGSARALHIAFSDGRVRFPEVAQVLLLGPGRYRLEGLMRGAVDGNRGLRWQLRCAAGTQAILGESESFLGRYPQWRAFSLDADIPSAGCVGQLLRLYHDSRSASEEFITGEAWFRGLELQRESYSRQR